MCEFETNETNNYVPFHTAAAPCFFPDIVKYFTASVYIARQTIYVHRRVVYTSPEQTDTNNNNNNSNNNNNTLTSDVSTLLHYWTQHREKNTESLLMVRHVDRATFWRVTWLVNDVTYDSTVTSWWSSCRCLLLSPSCWQLTSVVSTRLSGVARILSQGGGGTACVCSRNNVEIT